MDWDKIYANHMSDKELVSKIKTSKNLIAKILITQFKKMVKGHNRYLSKEETQTANMYIYEKRFKITNHQGNANQCNNEISSHTS